MKAQIITCTDSTKAGKKISKIPATFNPEHIDWQGKKALKSGYNVSWNGNKKLTLKKYTVRLSSIFCFNDTKARDNL